MPTVEAAGEYKASVMRLALGRLSWALPWLAVALALTFVRGTGFSFENPLRHPLADSMLHPLWPTLWTIAILVRWRRLSKMDPLELWRRDCGDPPGLEAGLLGKREALKAFEAGLQALPHEASSAIEPLRRAVHLDPANAGYWLTLGAALGFAGLPGEALPIMDKGMSLARQPVPPPVLFLRICCLQALLLNPDAQDAAREALPLIDDEEPRNTLQTLLEMPTPPFDRRDVAAYWFDAGRDAQSANRTDEAIEFFRRAVYADPQDATALGALATNLAVAGAREASDRLQNESLAAFAHALSLDPDPLIRFNHVQALHMFGRLQEALSAGQQLLTTTPDDPHLVALVEEIKGKLFVSGLREQVRT